MVEALTIVLAAGIAGGWRSSLAGVAAASAVLAVIVAILGPALTVIPIDDLRLVVGTLLLVFGLQWLRKAILRSSGFKALHDEDAIYAETLEQARAAHASGVPARVQRRPPRRARGRVHRAHVRKHPGEHPARRCGRRRGLRPRRRRRHRRARTSGQRPREHAEVRGRDHAHDVRHLLVGGRRRRRLAGRGRGASLRPPLRLRDLGALRPAPSHCSGLRPHDLPALPLGLLRRRRSARRRGCGRRGRRVRPSSRPGGCCRLVVAGVLYVSLRRAAA